MTRRRDDPADDGFGLRIDLGGREREDLRNRPEGLARGGSGNCSGRRISAEAGSGRPRARKRGDPGPRQPEFQPAEQDTIAALILEELADDTRWAAAFAASQPEIEQLAEKVRSKIRSGQTRDMRIEDL